ncbi:hypothetical protein DENSPDRAFT_835931 [Dentipellis sp. KUC8613]|nr:hypothetical protein DENSPDRAFT_835931 [Dentipellis sp. KUC8613]
MILETAKIRDAQPPFDRRDGDIIFRSSDGVDFHLHKLILQMASEAFEGMFSLPDTAANTSTSGADLAALPETARALDLFFRVIYPGVENPELKEIKDVQIVLELLQKYAVDGQHGIMDHVLRSLAERRPIAAFALASHYKYPGAEKAAAVRTLSRHDLGHALAQDSSDWSLLNAQDHRRLISYQRHCRDSIVELTKDLEWANPSDVPCSTYFIEPEDATDCICSRFSFGHVHEAPVWVENYMARCGEALDKKPLPAMVMDWGLVQSLWETAKKCPTCSRRAPQETVTFMQAFARKVEQEINAIDLDDADEDIIYRVSPVVRNNGDVVRYREDGYCSSL